MADAGSCGSLRSGSWTGGKPVVGVHDGGVVAQDGGVGVAVTAGGWCQLGNWVVAMATGFWWTVGSCRGEDGVGSSASFFQSPWCWWCGG